MVTESYKKAFKFEVLGKVEKSIKMKVTRLPKDTPKIKKKRLESRSCFLHHFWSRLGAKTPPRTPLRLSRRPCAVAAPDWRGPPIS